MKLLLLGATGRTGKWVLKMALEKGFRVNVLIRDATKVGPQSNLEVFEGLPAERDAVLKAAKECTAVITVLNISRTSDFPWAPLRTPKTLLSSTMEVLVTIFKTVGIKKVVVCSAWGVGDSKKDIPWWFRATIDHSNIKYAYADHQRQEEIVRSSDIDWTIVRPVGLTASKSEKQVRVTHGKRPRPRLTIGRRALAEFLIVALTEETLRLKTITVS